MLNMHTFLLAIIGVSLATASDVGSKILGGSVAGIGQFPGIVSLQNAKDSTHFCGGAIITERYILTAAHCFQGGNDNPANTVVRAGTTFLNDGGQFYNLSSIVVHPEFDNKDPTLSNDVAILKTQETIVFTKYVQPIKLATQDLDDGDADNLLTALGWGTTRYPIPNFPNDLYYVNVRLLNNEDCGLGLETNITEGQLCTAGRRGSGTCFGDSGGPLLVNDTTYGIVSWGKDCGFGHPEVFTRVTAYNNWIEQQTTE